MAKLRKVVTSQKLWQKLWAYESVVVLVRLTNLKDPRILRNMGVYSSIRCETSNDWCGNEFVLCLNGLWANSIESNEILHSIQKLTELIEIPT